MSASTKIWTTIKAFGKWAQKNPTLTAGFGGTGLLIANERTGRRDVKDAFHRELAAFHTDVDTKFAVVNTKFAAVNTKLDNNHTDLHAELELTQTLVLNTAIKTMKALDGDRKDLMEFIKEMEKMSSCIELGEDCQEVNDGGAGSKPADGNKKPVEK